MSTSISLLNEGETSQSAKYIAPDLTTEFRHTNIRIELTKINLNKIGNSVSQTNLDPLYTR